MCRSACAAGPEHDAAGGEGNGVLLLRADPLSRAAVECNVRSGATWPTQRTTAHKHFMAGALASVRAQTRASQQEYDRDVRRPLVVARVFLEE